MSSYLVLARKYRPRTFDEVIGQEATRAILTGALDEGRIGHAYLFSGPRGTGKTTSARIFAKCLNCESGPTSKPCGTCARCVAADAGTEVDIIELDAASHTGVDTIRELRDEVAYAPMRARYKVYIVDEVHMLSKAAFNALLKTLEEPPPHVVFLFATTEQHKVLDTIQSRCQLLRLSALSEERIAARLEEVFRLEGIQAEAGLTREIARGARGGMRDALSTADQLLALAGDAPRLEDLARLGGDGGARGLEELFEALEGGDKPRILTLMAGRAGDEGQLAAGLLGALRTSLVAGHCGADAPFLEAGEEERKLAHARAQRLGPARIELWMQELLRARERMRLLPDQAGLVLEVTLLDLASPETTIPLAELVERLEALGDAPAPSRPSAPATGRQPEPAPARTPAAEPTREHVLTPARAPAAPEKPIFEAFLAELAKTHGALSQLYEREAGTPALEPDAAGRHVLRFGALEERDRRLATDRRNQAASLRALRAVAGPEAELEIVLPGVAEAAPPVAASPTPPQPAPQAAPARQANKKDRFTETVADLFGGVIEDMS